MAGKRTHVVISEELVKEIDRLVGQRKRSRFISEAAQKEIDRLRFLEALRETAGAWKGKDHPELGKGVDRWVRKMRTEDEKRIKEVAGGKVSP